MPGTWWRAASRLGRRRNRSRCSVARSCSIARPTVSSRRLIAAPIVRRRCPTASWRTAAWFVRITDGRLARVGKCVTIPSSGEGASVPPRAHLAVYPIEERYGLVWICLGQPTAAIPTIAEEHDPAFRRINTPVDLWHTSATRMTDNFLDITHFPYVHIGTFGNAQDPKVPHLELEQLDDDWYGYRYEVLANNANLGSLASGQTSSVVERAMSTGFNLPFNVRSTIRYGTGLSHILLLLSTPVDDETSYFTFVVWRNDDFSISAEEVIRFDFAIGAEDKRMLEKLDGVLPLDATTLVSVQADKCSVEWRRRLVKLIAG